MKTHADIVAVLTPWATHYNAVKAAFEGGSDYFSVENPLSNSVWPLFESYTALLSECVGDDIDMLAWFCHENDMGQKGYGARPSSRHLMRPIRNLGDLAQFILDSQS